MRRIEIFLVALIGFASVHVDAAVRLPRIFSNGMVLQREQPVPVWGWAEAGERVTIKIAGQAKSTVADATGHWTVMIDPLRLGPPLTMSVSGIENMVEVRDVLVGDVYQCSGQSNAAMSLGSCKRYPGTQEDINSTTLPQVRIFQVPWGLFRKTPQEDVPKECAWESLRPEKNAGFSAIAFYFARAMHQQLKIPIGIVRASHAGGMAEIKMPKEALLSYARGRKFYEEGVRRAAAQEAKQKLENPDATTGAYPAGDWNGAIAPVIRYGKRGVLWYQGEHNAGSGSFGYRETLPVLIRAWRQASGSEALPLVWRWRRGGWFTARRSQAVGRFIRIATWMAPAWWCGSATSMAP